MEPVFFDDVAGVRAWFAEHHEREGEVVIGFRKRSAANPGPSYQDVLDEALCVGWIDGVRRTLDAERYIIRFTPRRKGSKWSAVNIRRVEDLVAAGRLLPAGLAAFELRHEGKDIVYSNEAGDVVLTEGQTSALRANHAAWAFWEAQPAGYRRRATHWVNSAKRPETREQRFATLVEDSAAGLRIGLLRREAPRGG